MRIATDRPDRAGFTLVELLIVISILGILAAVLLPRLLETREAANETATKGDFLQLETGLKAFSRKHGIFPPDDLRPIDGGAKTPWKTDNGRNTGIESLVCFLSQSLQDGLDLGGLADRLTNTDADDHGIELPLLRRRARVEVADAWQTPMVYFAKLGMDRAQQVQPAPEIDAVQVKAKRRPDGTPYGAGSFQLLSAGADMIFGNDDDLVWPAN